MIVDGRNVSKYIEQADAQVNKVRQTFPTWEATWIRPLLVFAHVDATSTLTHPYTIKDTELVTYLGDLPELLTQEQVEGLQAQLV